MKNQHNMKMLVSILGTNLFTLFVFRGSGVPWALLGRPKASLGRVLVSVWASKASLGLCLGAQRRPLGSAWAPKGVPWACLGLRLGENVRGDSKAVPPYKEGGNCSSPDIPLRRPRTVMSCRV